MGVSPKPLIFGDRACVVVLCIYETIPHSNALLPSLGSILSLKPVVHGLQCEDVHGSPFHVSCYHN